MEKIPVWELLYGVIFRPNKTFPLFRYYQPWGWAMAFLFIVNLVTILLAFLSLNSNDILWSLPWRLAGVIEPMRASMGIYASIFLYPLSIMFWTKLASIASRGHFSALDNSMRGCNVGPIEVAIDLFVGGRSEDYQRTNMLRLLVSGASTRSQCGDSRCQFLMRIASRGNPG